MRFLIREQDFETLIAAGRFRYDQDGMPSGVYESWRLTKITDGYSFLRVDLDARGADRDLSILYHLLLDPKGRPARLKLLLISAAEQLKADITFEEKSVMVTGEFDRDRFEDELLLEAGYSFWFPAASGLSLLPRNNVDQKDVTVVSFDEEQKNLRSQNRIRISSLSNEVYELGRQKILVSPYLIQGTDEDKRLWLDEHRWTVLVDFGNGQVARETQYIRYS